MNARAKIKTNLSKPEYQNKPPANTQNEDHSAVIARKSFALPRLSQSKSARKQSITDRRSQTKQLSQSKKSGHKRASAITGSRSKELNLPLFTPKETKAKIIDKKTEGKFIREDFR